MPKIPAAIRYKNPGAMWPGKTATKWGSTGYVTLNDGQGNKIAIFPTFVQGAAAQFDLWATKYTTGETLKQLIERWSGDNSPKQYVQFLEDRTGISIDTVVSKQLLASPAGWKLLKAQSRWEAGQEMPLSDAEWQQAQQMVFKGTHPDVVPTTFDPVKTIIRMGDRGEVVKKLQTALGFTGKDVDGVFGDGTRIALRAAQFTHGLANDGVCGPASWAMLKVTGA
jgi:peptidoglycan hydrolase-like protein with peptidoglycan-binding domain